MLVVLLAEVLTWYFDYRSFNATGNRAMSVVVGGILVSVVRMTVSRMLVVAVSLGYAVVKYAADYFLCSMQFFISLLSRYQQAGSRQEQVEAGRVRSRVLRVRTGLGTGHALRTELPDYGPRR